MRWRRSVAILVVFLALIFVVRTVWYITQNLDDSLPVVVDTTLPFYAVYFAGPDATGLFPEFHQGEGTIEEYIRILLQGPSQPNLSPVMPKDVQLIDYSLRGNILFLNFTHHLITNHPGGSTGEILTVYGIVNTVTGTEGVDKVQILVEGRLVSTLAGHLDLTEPLEKDYVLLGELY